jgi:hypothetical protein
MRTYLMLLTLTLAGVSALAQDPGMQAAQQAQLAAQAAQRASDQAMRDSQQASQAMQNAQQQAMRNAQCYHCRAATPKFSVKAGTYSSATVVRIKDASRGAVIYYTTDGWTPTAASTQYTGPITLDSTTTLQAVAIVPYGGRSRVATAVYTLNGGLPTPSAAQSGPAVPNATAEASHSAKLLLTRDTAVPLVFASDVSSKTADVGDKVSLTLAEDLKAGDVVVVKKGTAAVAVVTEVDKPRMMGVPGEVFFQVDHLKADDALIRLRGTAAKEGQDKEVKAATLMMSVPVVPIGLFVRGMDAEIKQGASFTAFVDADTLLSPAN